MSRAKRRVCLGAMRSEAASAASENTRPGVASKPSWRRATATCSTLSRSSSGMQLLVDGDAVLDSERSETVADAGHERGGRLQRRRCAKRRRRRFPGNLVEQILVGAGTNRARAARRASHVEARRRVSRRALALVGAKRDVGAPLRGLVARSHREAVHGIGAASARVQRVRPDRSR